MEERAGGAGPGIPGGRPSGAVRQPGGAGTHPDGPAEADPVAEIVAARAAARRAGDPCADVCYLLTIAASGRPEGRALILREVDARGFGALVSRTSPKWAQLSARPAGLLIYWPSVARQYRVAGPIVEMDRDDAEAFYKMKSHESMLLSHYYAAFHPQSDPIPSRAYFLAGIAELKARWPERDRVPMPEALAGIRMVPEEIETWHGVGESRLHDRRLYERGPSGWTSRTLVP